MSETDCLVGAERLMQFANRYLAAMGCNDAIAAEVAAHLVGADLSGVYSHGIFRLVSYAREAREGVFDPAGTPCLSKAGGGGPLIDGGNGFGMPALRMAVDEGVVEARQNGTSALGIANVAHTGQLGQFVERAAGQGCLCIIFGGGTRADWPQVAPYGGARGMLPTNPYALGMPAGDGGPVVLDFATAAGAGGKIYAARMAGRALPEGLMIDADGQPTTDPEDYFNGGAILPMAGPKGFGMGLVAELIGEVILGEAMSGMNWICVCIDLSRFRDASAYAAAAERCLAEVRACPPAPGFERVEIPGERERRIKAERLKNGVAMPVRTVAAPNEAATTLGLAAGELL
ncbi:MAG: Ldh family oxidoreductase [Rhizobiales bacterium]|nr:Ldh family oxidoreductase [Hyphomicrobiales bacterium]